MFPKQILLQQNERIGIVSVIQVEGLFLFMLGKLAKKKNLDPFPNFLYWQMIYNLFPWGKDAKTKQTKTNKNDYQGFPWVQSLTYSLHRQIIIMLKEVYMKSAKCPTSLSPVFRQGGDVPEVLMLEEWKEVRVKIFSFISEKSPH